MSSQGRVRRYDGASKKLTVRNGSASGVDVAEIQRARILTAMVEVCAERGAGNVTVGHVVGRAGVSRRTFYELFGDREDCFLAAFDDALARASRYILKAYEPSGKWAERIRSALTGLLEFLDAEPGAGQLLIIGSLGTGTKALERRKHVIAQMIATVDEGRNESKSSGAQFSPLTAESVVGGALAVLHARLLESIAPPVARSSSRNGSQESDSLLELAGPLMSMIVLPYLGSAASRRELERVVPTRRAPAPHVNGDPLRELRMRLTYRTVRVLMAVAAQPGGSNRQVGDAAGITDQGQVSKLLARLHGLGLIENTDPTSMRGAPNSWVLTNHGWKIQSALARNTS